MMYRSLVFVAGIAVQLLVAPLSCTAERRCLTEVFQPMSCSNFFGNGVEASLDPVDSNRLSSAQVSWPSLFPNSRNQSESDALSEFLDFSGLLHLDNYCSYLLHSFLCIHYFPPCNPSSTKNLMVLPCREVCELAMTECLNYVYEHYNATRPEHLNCTNFPVRAHVCDNEASDFIVACPTPAVHFDFILPLGNKTMDILEGSESSTRVCVKLASTGYHDSLRSPVTVNLTFEDYSAEGGVDYHPGNCTHLEFSAGSVKGDRKCCEIRIEDDDLVEGRELFSIHAQVEGGDESPETLEECGSGSGSGKESTGSEHSRTGDSETDYDDGDEAVRNGFVQFGGALKSSTGSLKVYILDNDECFMNPKHCTSKTCTKQRIKAAEDTYTTSNYTYAARVELLEVRNYSTCAAGSGRICTCTGINVRVIECWEVKKRHCPAIGKRLTIPTCLGCPRINRIIPGREYLIAGVRQTYKGKKMNVLPNSKKTGLFGIWKNSYTNVEMARWVSLAANRRS